MEYDKTRFLHIAPVEVRSFPWSVDLHDLDPLKPPYSYENLQYNKVIKYQKQRLHIKPHITEEDCGTYSINEF